MRFERIGERGALVHLVSGVGERGLELRMLELLDERAQRFDQRNA